MGARRYRDSVHAGDDLEPHAQTIAAGSDLSLGALLQQIRSGGYLPGGHRRRAGHLDREILCRFIATRCAAQQWPQVELLGAG